jgi:hypothetical protein
MRVRTVAGIAIVAACAATLPATAAGQPATPWLGTWQVNLAKSTFSPGPPPKSFVMTIVAADGGITQTVDSVSAAGAAGHSEITVRFDGTDYPMIGSSNTDTQAYIRIDDRTLQIVEKKGGRVTVTARAVISADGRTRTTTQTGTNPQGHVVNNVIVYDKVR